MRNRLSIKHPLAVNIGLAFLPFVVLVSSPVYSRILKILPSLGRAEILLIPIIYFICFKLAGLLSISRHVLEFDNEFLYLIDKKRKTETAIPIEKVIELNLRPSYFNDSQTMYSKYTLTYKDEDGNRNKIDFFHGTGNFDLANFQSLVKEKNPYFEYKSWHPFNF